MLLSLFLKPNVMCRRLLRTLVPELATRKAAAVAAAYLTDAIPLVRSRKLRKPEAIVDAVLDMVEERQDWGDSLVRAALKLSGTSRAQVKKKYREAALERVEDHGLKRPIDLVRMTLDIVREKQGWDAL